MNNHPFTKNHHHYHHRHSVAVTSTSTTTTTITTSTSTTTLINLNVVWKWTILPRLVALIVILISRNDPFVIYICDITTLMACFVFFGKVLWISLQKYFCWTLDDYCPNTFFCFQPKRGGERQQQNGEGGKRMLLQTLRYVQSRIGWYGSVWKDTLQKQVLQLSRYFGIRSNNNNNNNNNNKKKAWWKNLWKKMKHPRKEFYSIFLCYKSVRQSRERYDFNLRDDDDDDDDNDDDNYDDEVEAEQQLHQLQEMVPLIDAPSRLIVERGPINETQTIMIPLREKHL